MMTEPQLTRISKTLSYHLCHRPDALGLTLGPGGAERCIESASALARRIAAREVSAVAVLEAHLTQIARVNPALNAQYADVWSFAGGPVETFLHKMAVLDQHCAAVGRDPTAIQCSV